MVRRFKAAVDVLATLLMIVAAGALLWRLFHAPAPPAGRLPVEDVTGLTIPASRIANVRGTGAVTLIEFGDYECPYCAKHTESTSPQIRKEFVDTGAIRHVFLNFPLDIHPHAPKAAEAAACAGRQGKFWEMHESLFGNPKALEPASLMERAKAIGLEEAWFADCLHSGATADQVAKDREEGKRLGVVGTPAFFVGRRRPDGSVELVKKLNGALEFNQFEAAIRELLPERRARR